MPLIPGSGRIIFQDNIIRFDKVPLVTPNGDILVDELTFEVRSGINVLVCGPNGCGKSSLFRVLGEVRLVYNKNFTPFVVYYGFIFNLISLFDKENRLMISYPIPPQFTLDIEPVLYCKARYISA
jgi:ABC-type uncharacterized transport system fused permease/ATPase subunit